MRLYALIGSPAYPSPHAYLRDRFTTSVQALVPTGGTARQMVAIAADGDRSPLLGAIRMPTQIIHGQADPLVPVAAGRDLKRRRSRRRRSTSSTAWATTCPRRSSRASSTASPRPPGAPSERLTFYRESVAGQWRLCVAPMMDWTDRHCRYFHRLLTTRARLYTEMVTTGALLHGDVAAPSRLRSGRASGRAAARRQRAGRPRGAARASASAGATRRSTSIAAARASACSAARSAPA